MPINDMSNSNKQKNIISRLSAPLLSTPDSTNSAELGHLPMLANSPHHGTTSLSLHVSRLYISRCSRMYVMFNTGEAHVPVGESSMCSLSYTYLTSMLGAGIVGLPYVFLQSGIFGGTLLMIFVAYLSTYTLRYDSLSSSLTI